MACVKAVTVVGTILYDTGMMNVAPSECSIVFGRVK